MLGFLLELLLDPSGVLEGMRERRRERRIEKRARATQIRCALRVVEGAHPGLGRRWRRGTARVPPGSVVFEPDSRWRSRLTVAVRSCTLRPPGDTPRRGPRAVGPRPRLIVLETAGATLEWLVPEEQVERSMRVTRRSVRDARPPTG
ncbi:hypothetical protein DQ244_12725 [Blastococcus sp. TBT05-19]|uniref:hypothetical protein n=1 Tax=Blastococcus sp. TBT05-19 TaxID=2250581 RepID=UPI000DEADCA7|nr:hypothetical protein [Blastococcus sp. TBT05-19]RBY90314.1 hypothetical protein DQ244_12725 [Blastococcus sp. TBT05-19]